MIITLLYSLNVLRNVTDFTSQEQQIITFWWKIMKPNIFLFGIKCSSYFFYDKARNLRSFHVDQMFINTAYQ